MTTLLTGPEIRALRTEYGLTQSDLATKLGYSDRWLRAWENGTHPIPDAAADQLLAVIHEYRRARARQRASIEERLRKLATYPGESIGA